MQGCPLRCPGCCNPHYLTGRPAQQVSVASLLAEITHTPGIEGATFLGGEPFSQPEALGALAAGLRRAGLSVMVFSGHPLDHLRARPAFAPLLSQTDLLIDGPYQKDQPDTSRRWIGSTNQQIHFLTDRYQDLAGCWPSGETVELRLRRGADGAVSISMNGAPSQDISALIRASLRRKS